MTVRSPRRSSRSISWPRRTRFENRLPPSTLLRMIVLPNCSRMKRKHGQGNAHRRGGDQAVAERHADHHDDDGKVQHRPLRLQQMQTVAVDHPDADDDQDAGQGSHRNPGDEGAEGKKGDQRQHAFDDPGDTGLAATRQIDQRRPHLACTRHAAGTGRGDVAETLRDQLAVRIVATAGQRVEDDGRLERVDRQQHARVSAVPIRLPIWLSLSSPMSRQRPVIASNMLDAVPPERTDDQLVAFEDQHRSVHEYGEPEIRQHAGQAGREWPPARRA
jgi:hypothetical protein